MPSYKPGNVNENDINKVMADVRFDSLIFIFGFGEGEYLEDLLKYCCDRNMIYIIEPNREKGKKYRQKLYYDNINLIDYHEEILDVLLKRLIHLGNYINMYVSSYGDYSKTYNVEYKRFMELIDLNYFRAEYYMATNRYFKKEYLENAISNIGHINDSVSLDVYKDCNKNVPAIIVSEGLSLVKSIENMVYFKDKLDGIFIISEINTVKALMENGIKPDLIVSIDPKESKYDLMKDYVNEDIPFVFYEYSNKDVVNGYKGKKIFTTQGLMREIKGLEDLTPCYFGGTASHSNVDIAVKLGCNPIILVGQDFTCPLKKIYSQEDYKVHWDKEKEVIESKDVFGKKTFTNRLLDLYKNNMELYISAYNQNDSIEYINVSHGLPIKGAKFREFKSVLMNLEYKNKKTSLNKDNKHTIRIDIIKKNILRHVEDTINKAGEAMEICNKLGEKHIDEKAIYRFHDALRIIDDFVRNPNSLYFKGYLEEFLFDIKEGYFNMTAEEYPILTGNLIYQSKVFTCYFKELIDMLNEVKTIIVQEYNKYTMDKK